MIAHPPVLPKGIHNQKRWFPEELEYAPKPQIQPLDHALPSQIQQESAKITRGWGSRHLSDSREKVSTGKTLIKKNLQITP
jgi:hypothetical protein